MFSHIKNACESVFSTLFTPTHPPLPEGFYFDGTNQIYYNPALVAPLSLVADYSVAERLSLARFDDITEINLAGLENFHGDIILKDLPNLTTILGFDWEITRGLTIENCPNLVVCEDEPPDFRQHTKIHGRLIIQNCPKLIGMPTVVSSKAT